MFPGVSLFARFRWDPDLAPPLDAVRILQDMRDLLYSDRDGLSPGEFVIENANPHPHEDAGGRRHGEGRWGGTAAETGYFNHTLHTCAKGTFRRSKHGAQQKRGKAPSCPAHEWPSMRQPALSWVLDGGSARHLQVLD
jgi:hypothetical protein